MKSLLKVTQKGRDEYLKLYEATYIADCTTSKYMFVSRRDKKDLSVFNEKDKVDAVKILPYFYEDDKLYVVFIEEFRCPLNKCIFSFVAGLVDQGEEPERAAERELFEEIGAQTLNIEKVDDGTYSSAGMTDEKIMHFVAEVQLNGRQHLEKDEYISYHSVPIEQVLQFVDTHPMCMSSALLAKMFYYKHMAEN